ncbi:MAG: hypothetical protein MRY63_07540 [Neomegalonema sp.]|nr:hypothetical protein [Neomegalonema sp.]
MNRTGLGLGILALVAVAAVLFVSIDWSGVQRSAPKRLDPVSLSIFYGGEKSRLLGNPEVARIIEQRYKIDLDARKAGSIEMATTLDSHGIDCLWPSNQIAVELAKQSGKPVRGDENIFNSPIVFYAWADVADALTREGVVQARADGLLIADVSKIGLLIRNKARWKEDLGLNIYGPVKVFSTHPAKSNSGNIWSGLLATVFNGGSTPTAADLPGLLPKIEDYFGAMGHMEASSGDIFENFLKQGMGARPIIVGYENQLVEFLVENAAYAEQIRQSIRVIYPEPTIFASHPLISLTSDCGRLVEALQDTAIQDIAWREHGFRTGLIGVQNDPEAIEVTKLPARIDLVTPMPGADVMTAVINAVR